MNSALCPETSTKLYVHEFGFYLEIIYTLYLILEGVDILISESFGEPGIAVPIRAVDLFTHKKHACSKILVLCFVKLAENL